MNPTVSDSRILRREGSWIARSLGEHARRFEHLRLRHCVEQRALACVCVTNQRDCRHWYGFTPLPLLPSHLPDAFQFPAQLHQAFLDTPAVCLKLGFTRPPGTDAAACLRHTAAASRQAGKHVFQLRQFNLELPFPGSRMAGEYIQDQLRPVKHPARQLVLKVAQLRWRQVMVKQHDLCLGRCNCPRHFLHLPFADQGCRIRPGPPLYDFADDDAARTGGELAELDHREFCFFQGRRMHARCTPWRLAAVFS